jgi:putative transposase
MEDKRQYPSDLTDEEWAWLEHLLPKPKTGGRPIKHSRRLIADTILYFVRSGCACRMLPKDLPPCPTVYDYFRQSARQALWLQMHDILRVLVRYQSRRTPTPTAAILDSQSVKMGDQVETRDVDADKKVNGRKRHVLTDTLQLILLRCFFKGNSSQTGTLLVH